MLESVRCPNCSTHYGLRAGRVRAGLRRACCFRCGTTFGIEPVVARLLALQPEPLPEAEGMDTLGFGAPEPFPEPVALASGEAEFPVPQAPEPGVEVEPAPTASLMDELFAAAEAVTPLAPEAPAAPEPEPLPDLLGGALRFESTPEAAAPPPTVPEPLPPEPEVIAAGDLDLFAEPEALLEEAPVPEVEARAAAGTTVRLDASDFAALRGAAIPPESAPTLTLGDLEDADADLLERTVVDFTSAPPPEVRPLEPEASPAAAPVSLEDDAAAPSTYTSAKDAIDKLLGGVPKAIPGRPIPTSRTSTQMDVEATLSALERTLGGIQPSELQAAPPIPPPAPAPPAPAPQVGGTVRLSQTDLMAAMTAPDAPLPAAPPSAPLVPALPPPPREPSPASATMILPLSSVPREPLVPPLQPAPPMPVPLAPPPPAKLQDSNLLRVKAGEENFENLSMEELVRMVEGFRVLEYHLVARQFSDHWIEAAKVPALRPIFERIRRGRGGQPEAPPAPQETLPPAKKSLFGGLFNRG